MAFPKLWTCCAMLACISSAIPAYLFLYCCNIIFFVDQSLLNVAIGNTTGNGVPDNASATSIFNTENATNNTVFTAVTSHPINIPSNPTYNPLIQTYFTILVEYSDLLVCVLCFFQGVGGLLYGMASDGPMGRLNVLKHTVGLYSVFITIFTLAHGYIYAYPMSTDYLFQWINDHGLIIPIIVMFAGIYILCAIFSGAIILLTICFAFDIDIGLVYQSDSDYKYESDKFDSLYMANNNNAILLENQKSPKNEENSGGSIVKDSFNIRHPTSIDSSSNSIVTDKKSPFDSDITVSHNPQCGARMFSWFNIKCFIIVMSCDWLSQVLVHTVAYYASFEIKDLFYIPLCFCIWGSISSVLTSSAWLALSVLDHNFPSIQSINYFWLRATECCDTPSSAYAAAYKRNQSDEYTKEIEFPLIEGTHTSNIIQFTPAFDHLNALQNALHTFGNASIYRWLCNAPTFGISLSQYYKNHSSSVPKIVGLWLPAFFVYAATYTRGNMFRMLLVDKAAMDDPLLLTFTQEMQYLHKFLSILAFSHLLCCLLCLGLGKYMSPKPLQMVSCVIASFIGCGVYLSLRTVVVSFPAAPPITSSWGASVTYEIIYSSINFAPIITLTLLPLLVVHSPIRGGITGSVFFWSKIGCCFSIGIMQYASGCLCMMNDHVCDALMASALFCFYFICAAVLTLTYAPHAQNVFDVKHLKASQCLINQNNLFDKANTG